MLLAPVFRRAHARWSLHRFSTQSKSGNGIIVLQCLHCARVGISFSLSRTPTLNQAITMPHDRHLLAINVVSYRPTSMRQDDAVHALQALRRRRNGAYELSATSRPAGLQRGPLLAGPRNTRSAFPVMRSLDRS